MNQTDIVVEVMEENGGFATLGDLYRKVMAHPEFKSSAQQPDANIRRIVQKQEPFFKIKPGLWALKSYRHKLPDDIEKIKRSEQKSLHSYYQGLLLEIGKLEGKFTYVTHQDKNRAFLGRQKLIDVANCDTIFEFTYPEIVDHARHIDVIWFNERRLPDRLYEVENSTDMRDALLKFMEMQDFNNEMIIVADEKRKSNYKKAIALSAFGPIQRRVKFNSYEQIEKYHQSVSLIASVNMD